MVKRLPSQPPRLPGLTVVRPIGTGGFSDVYLYQQEMPRRPVAVKVLLHSGLGDDLLRMFNSEADTLARLSSHPSILTVYDAGIAPDGRPYLVTEFCPTSVFDAHPDRRLTVSETLELGVRLAGALETAHRAGILHRDIKPSNILRTSFGAPVLADFGIAASLGGGPASLEAMSIPWSAPDVVLGRTSGTVATEVWSLGATLYTLLAGRSPFALPGRVNDRRRLVERIGRGLVPAIGRSDVPAVVENALRGAMRRDPQQRYASAERMGRELQRVQQELGQPVTMLEITDERWAAAGPPIRFDDPEWRGETRSRVGHRSRRRRRGLTPSASDDGVEPAPGRSLSPRSVGLIALGSALGAAGVAVLLPRLLA